MATIKFASQPLDRKYAVTSKFGSRKHPITGVYKKHAGIDLDVYDTKPAYIYAVNPGTVIISTHESGYGYYTVIDHGEYSTLYAHMKYNSLQRGMRVGAGQVIGLMGSTGASSGDHLHFEIRVGRATNREEFYRLDPINPQPYLEGTSTSVPSAHYANNTASSTDTSLIPSGPIVGRRVSDVTSQPVLAYVNIYIGDKLLSTSPPKPNILQMFEFSRLEEAGSTATFTLFDDNWDEIEQTLASNWENIYIEYGYYNKQPSKRYNLMVQNYSISFAFTGVLLSVSAISIGQYQNLNSISLALDTRNPTEAVKIICNYMSWTVIDENFDSSQDIPLEEEPFNLVEEYPITYIQNVIIPYASNADEGEEIFQFYLDEDNIAYFKKTSYGSVNTTDKDIRTYIYQKGYDSVVKDLSFDIKGVFGGTSNFSIASGYKSSVFDPKNKTQESYEATTKSTVTESPGTNQHMKENQSIPLIDSAGNSPKMMKNKLYYYIKNATNSMYEATMTIVGDPSINILENIRIINITDSGYLHHTSGRYMIKGIVDKLHGGQLLTTLKLIRNGDIEQGIEIINPKSIMK